MKEISHYPNFELLIEKYYDDKTNFLLNFYKDFNLENYNYVLDNFQNQINNEAISYKFLVEDEDEVDIGKELKKILEEINHLDLLFKSIRTNIGHGLVNEFLIEDKEEILEVISIFKDMNIFFLNDLETEIINDILKEESWSYISHIAIEVLQTKARLEFDISFFNLLNFLPSQYSAYSHLPFKLKFQEQKSKEFNNQIFVNQAADLLFFRLVYIFGQYNNTFSFLFRQMKIDNLLKYKLTELDYIEWVGINFDNYALTKIKKMENLRIDKFINTYRLEKEIANRYIFF